MTEFKVGDRVRFVDESGSGWSESVQNQQYTVTAVEYDLIFVDGPRGKCGERAGGFVERFVLIEPRENADLEAELADLVTEMRAAGYDVDVKVVCPPVERNSYTV